uniref:Uncharacterized protein n=1 Tax=Arundo donax TaxID=35708 RepID=A0A0A9FVB6_ARUDO
MMYKFTACIPESSTAAKQELLPSRQLLIQKLKNPRK